MVELPIRYENVDQTRGIKLLLFSYSISLRKVFNWMKYRGRSYIIAHYIFRKSNFFFKSNFPLNVTSLRNLIVRRK